MAQLTREQLDLLLEKAQYMRDLEQELDEAERVVETHAERIRQSFEQVEDALAEVDAVTGEKRADEIKQRLETIENFRGNGAAIRG